MVNSTKQPANTGDPGRVDGRTLRTWELWRNIAVCFCLFSLVGHWMEIPYCAFNDWAFGIVDPDTEVFDDPMFPYLVYGIGTLVFTLVFVPLKEWLARRLPSYAVTLVAFFAISVFACMAMELSMGLLMNQPDVTGDYPLWDNSQLPFNVLGQAWLVNDFLLGMVATLYSWVFWPALSFVFAHIPRKIMNVSSVVFVAAFIVLCIVKFA